MVSNLLGKLLCVIVVGGLASGAALADPKQGKAKGIKTRADLSSAQETAPTSPGFIESASITADFSSDLSTVKVKLKIKGGDNVVAAHLHCGRPGTNGPVAFGLFSPGPLTFDGVQAAGTLTNADFTGADCTPVVGRPVSNIAALAFAIRDGLIYVNVHTSDNPPGEVRGQLSD